MFILTTSPTGKGTAQIFKPIKKNFFNILNMIKMVKGL